MGYLFLGFGRGFRSSSGQRLGGAWNMDYEDKHGMKRTSLTQYDALAYSLDEDSIASWSAHPIQDRAIQGSLASSPAQWTIFLLWFFLLGNEFEQLPTTLCPLPPAQ